MNDKRWLSLSQAAAELDIHPTTLRRWADSGAIGVMVTPGGHRRFDRDEIGRFVESQRTKRRDNVQTAWAENAIQQTRQQITRREQAIVPASDEARVELRKLGQRLVGLAMRYMAADESAEQVLLDEANDIGRQYGTLSQLSGLSLTDALKASLFFHQQLLESSLELPTPVSAETGNRILRRINRLLNTVHLGIAAMYE